MNRLLAAAAATLLILGLVATSQAVSFGSMGTKASGSGADFNPQYAASLLSAATLCARDTGTTSTSTDDLFYINIDGSGSVVATQDLRVTSAESRTAGTFVSSSDTDAGVSFNSVHASLSSGCTTHAAFEDRLKSLEADGLPGWTAGDFLIWDASNDGILNAGDIRIAVATSNTGQDSQSVTAGTIVGSGSDTDLTSISNNNGLYPDCTAGPPTGATCSSSAILADGGNFDLRAFDANMNGAVDSGDSILVAYDPANTPNPLSYSLNDVYLTGSTFGSKVTRSSADYLAEPEVLCASPPTVGCYTTAPVLGYIRVGGSDSDCDRLFVHFRNHDGIANVVQVDDVVLYSPSASCTSPIPASSVSMGTRVSSTSHHQGTAFQGTSALAQHLFYVDANTNSRFDLTDPAYLNKPAAFGGAAGSCTTAPLCVTIGDLRLTTVTASTTYSAGTIVSTADSDISAFASSGINTGSGSNGWVVRTIDNDGADEIPLNAVSSVMYHDANSDSIWNPTTESIYLDVGTTANGCGSPGTGTTLCVNTGDFLLYDGDQLASTGPSTATPITCSGGSPNDCAAATTAFKSMSTDVKVTGSDATIEASRGETLYYSKDAFVNNEDFALSAATSSSVTAGAVTCASNACRDEGLHASDQLVFSWCPSAGCPGRLLQGDVHVAPSPSRQASSGADFVPSLRVLPVDGATLVRYNRGDTSSVADDVFYASTDGSSVSTQDVRMTASATKVAGTVVTSADTEETNAGNAIAADTAGNFNDLLFARDVDGITGYSLGDAVYVNNPGGTLGGSSDSLLSVGDLRVTETTSGGSSYAAGTQVVIGDKDPQAGTAPTGLGSWLIGYHDDNMNGVFDDGDVMYGLPPGSAALSTLPQPPLGAVRLSGPGGGTVTSGGGGGGTTVIVTTSTSGTGSTSLSTSGSASVSASGSGNEDPLSLAAINLRLQDSLDVDRKDGENVLTWDAQSGVTGYQVFSADSPFVLLATLDNPSTSTFTDINGGAKTDYLVTAYQGTPLTADDVNDGNVPGYSGVPEGKDSDGKGGGKGWIPGPGLALLTLALAAAVLVARRKL